MFKYTLKFRSDWIDDAEIREALAEIGIFDISVDCESADRESDIGEEISEGDGEAAGDLSRRRSSLLDLFSKGEVYSFKELSRMVDAKDQRFLRRDLSELVRVSELLRVGSNRFGLNTASNRAGASAAVESMSDYDRRVIEFLRSPKTGPEIADYLGVTRQRAQQVLKVLMGRGWIFRGVLPKGRSNSRYIYSSEKDALVDDLRGMKSQHSEDAEAVFNVISTEGYCRLSDVVSATGLDSNKVLIRAEELADSGLVRVEFLKSMKFIGLTDAGRERRDGVKVDPVQECDLFDEFGEARSRVLQLLNIMGDAASLEMSKACRVLCPDVASSIGRTCQGLMKDGLIEIVSATPGGHHVYRITQAGSAMWEVISGYRPSLSREKVSRLAEEGEETLTAERKSKARSREWHPTDRAIDFMKSLAGGKELSLAEIKNTVSENIPHRGSMSLVSKTLYDRGLISRRGEGTRWSPFLYFLTESGEEVLKEYSS